MDKVLTKESIFIIGRVVSVDGRIVTVKVNKNKNNSHLVFEGQTIKNVSVGSYVKIVKGFTAIIGKVESEFISEESVFNREYNKEETRIDRTLRISLFGHFEGDRFRQGIKEMPLIDNECFILDYEEFYRLHQFFDPCDKTITIGCLSDDPAQRISLSVNKLFASHIGIFGNTGSGKSNTLARILTELFLECDFNKFRNNSRFVVIDFNGEYTKPDTIDVGKTIYKLSTRNCRDDDNKYPMSKEAINKQELLSVLFEATEKTQKPFLSRALNNKKIDNSSSYNATVIEIFEEICRSIIKKNDKSLGVNIFMQLFKDIYGIVEEYPFEISVGDIINLIEDNLHYHSVNNDYYWGESNNNNYDNVTPIYENHLKECIDDLLFKNDEISKLKTKVLVRYYQEIIKGYSNQEHIRPLIGRMFKKLDLLETLIKIEDSTCIDNNMVVISLKDVEDIEMKKVLPLLICKQLYDKKKENENKDNSLHIIIDEAHNILSTMSQRESENWKDYRLETFEEIIKEGRKFGTFLTIASQRPHDIAPTIVSQLHNYFIHRLINDHDIKAISKTVAYLDKLSFESIPILPVGGCFVAGLASDIPIKVTIDLLDEKKGPSSETIDLEKSWGINSTESRGG